MNLPSLVLPTTFELSNGHVVTIRAIHPGDAPLLVEMFGHLSARTRRLRYHAFTAELPMEQAILMSDLDPARQAALVATVREDGDERIIGVTQLARASAGTVEAELAIVVRDDFQGMGLGTHLLTHLLAVAHSTGVQRLFGWIKAENRTMLHLFQKTDLPICIEHCSDEVLVEVTLTT
jgi:GNAT superfamily N-acetyltransferase